MVKFFLEQFVLCFGFVKKYSSLEIQGCRWFQEIFMS